MKFRIRDLTPGFRLEVCVAAPVMFNVEDPPKPDVVIVGMFSGTFVETWVPIGHPYGTITAAKGVAEHYARGGRIVEEFDVEVEREVVTR